MNSLLHLLFPILNKDYNRHILIVMQVFGMLLNLNSFRQNKLQSSCQHQIILRCIFVPEYAMIIRWKIDSTFSPCSSLSTRLKKVNWPQKRGLKKKFGNQGVVAAAGKEKTSSNKKIEVQDWYPKICLQCSGSLISSLKYKIVVSTSLSCFEAHVGLFRLIMNRNFN